MTLLRTVEVLIACVSPLKLGHYLMFTCGFKDNMETVFGRRCTEGFASSNFKVSEVFPNANHSENTEC